MTPEQFAELIHALKGIQIAILVGLLTVAAILRGGMK